MPVRASIGEKLARSRFDADRKFTIHPAPRLHSVTPRQYAEPWFFVRDPAGPFVKAFTEAFYKPFFRATGIRPVRVSGGVEPTAMIRDMVDRRDYAWDVALVSKSCHLALTTDGADYLEPLEPVTTAMPAEYRSSFFSGNDVYANVLAYRTDSFAGRTAPGGWADFWNVGDFPGRRSLRNHPMDTVEEALLADGVALGQLCPYDLGRAFDSLASIRPYIDTWWSGAAIQTRLLTSGRIDLCAISSIRAQHAIESGAPVGIAWQGNIRSVEGWVILKGTPKRELCRRFVAFVADAQRQAVFARYINSSPTLPGAQAHLDPERAALMPDAHRDQAAVSDAQYWAQHKDALVDRFTAWRRQRTAS